MPWPQAGAAGRPPKEEGVARLKHRCRGECEIRWLTVYDAFYGSAEHTQSVGTLAEPFQLPWGASKWATAYSQTKRRDGDYYVAIDALPGLSADVEMQFFLLDPGPAPARFQCSRFDGFCPSDHYSVGYSGSLSGVLSAAPRRQGGRAIAPLVALAAAVLTAPRVVALACGGAARPGRIFWLSSAYQVGRSVSVRR